MLARTSIRLGTDSSRGRHLQRPLAREAMEPEDYYRHGALVSRGKVMTSQPLKAWTKAVAETPDHPEMLLSLANLFARRQRLDEAVTVPASCRRSPAGRPPDCSSWGRTGSRSKIIRRPPTLRRGLELDPEAGLRPPGALRLPQDPGTMPAVPGPAEEADRWLEPVLKSGQRRACRSRGALAGQPVRPPAAPARSGQGGAGEVRNAIAPSIPLFLEPSPYAGEANCPRATRRSPRPTTEHVMRGRFITGQTC